MIPHQDDLLRNLGYDISSRSCNYFNAVVEEVVEIIDDHSREEVIAFIQNKKSHIYVEPACFYFEVGLNKFHQSLADFHCSKNSANIDIQKIIFGSIENPTLEDTIFFMAQFISKSQEKEAENRTRKVRTLS